MNLKPEQIPDEAANLALEAYYRSFNSGHDFSINHMKAALAAALPVLLVQVGFAAPESLSPSNRRMSWFDVWRTQHPPFTTPLYTIPTQDTPNADQ